MTEFDQREELHAALGRKMMGSSLMTERAGSNPDRFRYNSEDPSHSTTANRDKYHAAGIAAMDAYGNARIDAGKLPTRQGCIDAAVRGIAAAVIRDRAREVVGKLFDTYIDDATGAQVSADWWPGDPVTHERAS